MLNTLPAEVFDAIGVAGFGLYVLNYTLLTVKRLSSESISYFILNLLAATCVLIGLTTGYNLASMLNKVFWIGISIVAICLRLRQRRPAPMARLHPIPNGRYAA